MSSRLQSAFFRGFALASLAILLVPAACDTSVTTTGTTSDVTATNGTGFTPPCNDNHQDGYCNAHGAIPESCECLDCSDTAYCKEGCKDDGSCDANGGEDCTCTDCFGQTIDGDECPFSSMQGGPVTTSPASASASSGGGMGGASSAAQTTAAQTTAMSSSAAGTGGMSSSSSN